MTLLRLLWTQLTSMRTALILLFILALAAIPGSFVPQRPVNPIRVSDFVAECEAFTADDTHAHDDQIDPMVDAINDMLAKKRSIYDNL